MRAFANARSLATLKRREGTPKKTLDLQVLLASVRAEMKRRADKTRKPAALRHRMGRAAALKKNDQTA